MGNKFIPNGDLDFLTMAGNFARTIARNPAGFAVSQADADTLSSAVAKYEAAFQAARHGGSRSSVATRAKDEARAEAERIIRRLTLLIRASDAVDSVAKVALSLRERPAKMKSRKCPQEPPRLRFVRALHEGGGASPMHELKFEAMENFTKSKPPGDTKGTPKKED